MQEEKKERGETRNAHGRQKRHIWSRKIMGKKKDTRRTAKILAQRGQNNARADMQNMGYAIQTKNASRISYK